MADLEKSLYFGEKHIPKVWWKARSNSSTQYKDVEVAFSELSAFIVSTFENLHKIAYSEDRTKLEKAGIRYSFNGHDEKFSLTKGNTILEVFVHYTLDNGTQIGASHTILPNSENENGKNIFKFKKGAYSVSNGSFHEISFSTENISENKNFGSYIEAISGTIGSIGYQPVVDERKYKYYKFTPDEAEHSRFYIDTTGPIKKQYFSVTSWCSFEKAYVVAKCIIGEFMSEFGAVLNSLDDVKYIK